VKQMSTNLTEKTSGSSEVPSIAIDAPSIERAASLRRRIRVGYAIGAVVATVAAGAIVLTSALSPAAPKPLPAMSPSMGFWELPAAAYPREQLPAMPASQGFWDLPAARYPKADHSNSMGFWDLPAAAYR